jgi:Zn-dependent hydrolases, including glyoxylases
VRELAEGVWQIDDLGYVNAYLWQWQGGLTLIDTGLPWQGRKILSSVRDAGLDPALIREIIITHADIDHYGGLKTIRQETGARLYVHAIEAMYFKGRWSRKPNLHDPLGVLYFPFHTLLTKIIFRMPQLRPDLLMVDEEQLENGLMVVHTPGHTPGHISLYSRERGVLFVGDLITNRGGKLALPPALFTPQMAIVKESIRKVARLKGVEVAGFGHGPALTAHAGDKIRELARQVAPARRRRPKKQVAVRKDVPRQPKADH